ncbi:VCBS repeat-containing protein [Flagellimonas pacifica]|uniref:Repeat domain-containing protein n=1 Tax=Flagellimonas pacifica TaxID=1247520 RepID=A0A285MFY8_9FLAO|nr:VCBS repeat-containing protein [Allomuricauda parva]SNY94856.1 Repeat domain-containing protein [Allomuricauda parva]
MKNVGVFFFLLLILSSCETKRTGQFKLLSASQTGINFNNKIEENDSINVFQYMNIYTGAGVAVGDVNNDGLTDVYFSGNMVSGRLYLNMGNLKFKDITETAGLLNDSWGTGATMVDIDQDGLLDIYISVSGGGESSKKANLLYINNGSSTGSGEITFTEKAKEYGLADTKESMQAAFFDYDKDQDLDMYLLINPAAYSHMVNSSKPRKLNGESISNDRLYRNDGNGKFTDVSKEAGILIEGYGLGVGISDINNDSWPDIYISNDFIGNDILYINQGDGTFKDEIASHLNHTSYAGMGNTISDIDNNGRPDIMVLDMRPEDNARQKTIISSTGYDRFQIMLEAGYQHQYSRNTLQLNLGEGKFSEIGNMAGVSSTDWSWSSLIADYDNDGYKDLYVTNGFLRDLGDLDYIHYQGIYDNPLGDPETKIKQKLNSIKALPPAKLPNYMYKNNGNLRFKDVSETWGIEVPSCSNGAAYADLDNDGDLDLIINNMNQTAFVYENKGGGQPGRNFLKLKLNGKAGNIDGIGAKVKLTTSTSIQYDQHFLSKGYESSVDPVMHFGIGEEENIIKIEIWWPNNEYQIIENVAADQLIEIDQNDAGSKRPENKLGLKKRLFSEYTDSLGISFAHVEDDVVDFKLQPIIPHMQSRNGPGISVSDMNSDGLEDFYVGGAAGQSGQLWIQNQDATFTLSDWSMDANYEDMGSLIFDANGDGHNDLYVVSGGVQLSDESAYQDRLYVNDGKGNLIKSDALPNITNSGSTVNAVDFDKDGDLDLFVGGRVSPGKYPLPAKSYLLENISDKDNGARFKDISDQVDNWEKLTMVTAGLWTDYDNDGWIDLIVVGEFMALEFFHNENGKLINATKATGLDKTEGWWNSIAGGDFDNDGDTDYILGNLGLNHKYSATDEEPLCIYASDYDMDGNIDPIMCYYNDGENYIAHSRDELINQISAMRSRFKTYKSYAEVTFEESFLPEELKKSYVVKSHRFASSYLENLGNGVFKLSTLPILAQTAPVEGIVVEDFDKDGLEDVLLTGNSYATEVATGRYDGLLGVVMISNGDGSFNTLELDESGFLNDFDGSGLAILKNAKNENQIMVANNNGPLKIFKANLVKENHRMIHVGANATYANIILKDGRKYKKEFYHGSGYLSQSSRNILVNEIIKKVQITDVNGTTETSYNNETIN